MSSDFEWRAYETKHETSRMCNERAEAKLDEDFEMKMKEAIALNWNKFFEIKNKTSKSDWSQVIKEEEGKIFVGASK